MNSKPNHKVIIVTADTREELYNIMKQRAAQRKLAKEQRTAANLLDRGKNAIYIYIYIYIYLL